jgi:DNA-directed RNA polymerase subunit RPC12/RpoP
VKLLCQHCGHRGSADLSFIWYSKAFKTEKAERRLWLCPDCFHEFESDKERNRFLRERLKG